MTNTVIGRYGYLIGTRKERIEKLEDILSGRNKKYNYNLEDIKRKLEAEKQCLHDLLTGDIYQAFIDKEKHELIEKYCG